MLSTIHTMSVCHWSWGLGLICHVVSLFSENPQMTFPILNLKKYKISLINNSLLRTFYCHIRAKNHEKLSYIICAKHITNQFEIISNSATIL